MSGTLVTKILTRNQISVYDRREGKMSQCCYEVAMLMVRMRRRVLIMKRKKSMSVVYDDDNDFIQVIADEHCLSSVKSITAQYNMIEN